MPKFRLVGGPADGKVVEVAEGISELTIPVRDPTAKGPFGPGRRGIGAFVYQLNQFGLGMAESSGLTVKQKTPRRPGGQRGRSR